VGTETFRHGQSSYLIQMNPLVPFVYFFVLRIEIDVTITGRLLPDDSIIFVDGELEQGMVMHRGLWASAS